MSVLITGGTGYIGSHTCVDFIQKGKEIVILDNLSNSKAEVVDHIETITGIRPKFYEVDLLDREGVQKVFDENDIDTVIQFAGLKAVGESVAKSVEYYRNNIDTTLTLLEVMKEVRTCYK